MESPSAAADGEQAAVVGIFWRQAGFFDEPRGAAGEVHHFADQIGIHFGDELVGIQIEIVHARTELAGVVVAQVRGVEMFQVGGRLDERPLALRHLLAADGQETVDVDFRRQLEAGGLQHAGPEQRVEIGDVFADEVVDFDGRFFGIFSARPPFVERLASLSGTTR